MPRQEHAEGFGGNLVADEQADPDQTAHLQQKRVVYGVQDRAVEMEILINRCLASLFICQQSGFVSPWKAGILDENACRTINMIIT